MVFGVHLFTKNFRGKSFSVLAVPGKESLRDFSLKICFCGVLFHNFGLALRNA